VIRRHARYSASNLFWIALAHTGNSRPTLAKSTVDCVRSTFGPWLTASSCSGGEDMHKIREAHDQFVSSDIGQSAHGLVAMTSA
jgi:hypothetical protein